MGRELEGGGQLKRLLRANIKVGGGAAKDGSVWGRKDCSPGDGRREEPGSAVTEGKAADMQAGEGLRWRRKGWHGWAADEAECKVVVVVASRGHCGAGKGGYVPEVPAGGQVAVLERVDV